MQKIPLSLAKPGMNLIYAITGTNETVLASEGDTLDDALLRRLDMAGVTDIVVDGNAVQGYGMGYDAALRLERLPQLFRKYENNAFMATLQKMLHSHFAERM